MKITNKVPSAHHVHLLAHVLVGDPVAHLHQPPVREEGGAGWSVVCSPPGPLQGVAGCVVEGEVKSI